jgi:hypothetical protein
MFLTGFSPAGNCVACIIPHLRVLGVTKKRSSISHRLVYCEIFRAMRKRAKHRSLSIRLSPNLPLCRICTNPAIPRSLRETMSRKYRRESNVAAIFGNHTRIPKVSGDQVTF